MSNYDPEAAPKVLTALARVALDRAEALKPENTMARFVPNTNAEGKSVTVNLTEAIGSDLGGFRSEDADVSFSKDSKISDRKTFHLMPLTDKGLVTENEQMSSEGTPEEARARNIARHAVNRALALGMRMEKARAEAIYFSQITIAENGLKDVIKFGRKASNSTAPTVAWTDYANSTPITDLRQWAKDYEALNDGIKAGLIQLSGTSLSLVRESRQVKDLVQKEIVTDADFDALMKSIQLPPVEVNDNRLIAQVGPGAARAPRVTPENMVAFLPAPGATSSQEIGDFGATFWTRSASAQDPEYDLADVDQFNIVVGAYRVPGMPQAHVRADAYGMPAIWRPQLTFVATVFTV